jgi:hypothetical protein
MSSIELKALDTLIKVQAEAAAITVESCDVAVCSEELHWCTGCGCHLVAAYECSNCD